MKKHSIIQEHWQANRKKYLFLISFLIAGIFIGSLSLRFLSEKQQLLLVDYLKQFFTALSDQSKDIDKASLLKSSLISDVKGYLFITVFGLTTMGCIFTPAFVLFKGFILGFTNTFLLMQFGFKGFLFSFFTIFPQNLIKLAALLFTGVCVFSFSLKKIEKKRNNFSRPSSGLYLTYAIAILIGFAINFAGILIESYIIPFFMFIFSPELL